MNTPLRTLLYELKNEYKEQPAFLFVEEGRVKAVSYEKFLQDILSQSSHYQQLSQKRIGLWGYNSYQWLTAAVGILLAGCHGIFFDGNLENQDLIYLAEYSDTEWMAVEPELMEEESSIGGHFQWSPTQDGRQREPRKFDRKQILCVLLPAHPAVQKGL